MENTWILKVTKPDQPGIIANITRILYSAKANIVENEEFVDPISCIFFMRTEFRAAPEKMEEIRFELNGYFTHHDDWTLVPKATKKIWVLCTKEHHCLGDILLRNLYKEWNAEVVGVISNHNILKQLSDRFDSPYFYVSHEDKTREEHEKEIKDIISSKEFDYIVLAKYMRVLSPDFVSRFDGKIINIHHSFLPAFTGARPYHQAFVRGVKIIGATAHFVNSELDQGPIIHQSIREVDHSYTEEDLIRAGRDVEVQVLSHALNLTFEERVFIYQNKTVVFR
jgi:formyltetrahydrofolate deformylase